MNSRKNERTMVIEIRFFTHQNLDEDFFKKRTYSDFTEHFQICVLMNLRYLGVKK